MSCLCAAVFYLILKKKKKGKACGAIVPHSSYMYPPLSTKPKPQLSSKKTSEKKMRRILLVAHTKNTHINDQITMTPKVLICGHLSMHKMPKYE